MKIKQCILSTNIYEFKGTESEIIHHLKRNDDIYEVAETKIKLFSFLNDYPSSIVYLMPLENVDSYELCSEISISYPYASIILLFNQGNLNYKKSMYVGATDSLVIPTSSIDIQNCIYKAKSVASLKHKSFLKTLRSNKMNSPVDIITICSGKGGVGKTTLTVNMATQLAKIGKKVVILDLDLQFGDVNIFLNVKSRKTIYDWALEHNGNKHAKITRYLTTFQDNLNFVAAPIRPEQAELIKGEHIDEIIEQLSLDYEIIIVDTPPLFTESVLSALKHSTKILIPTTPNLTSIKNVKTTVETLKQLDWEKKSYLILNRANEAKKMIKVKDIETIVGKKIWAEIPSDYKTSLTSINFGIPFVSVHPSKRISKSIIKITEKITIGLSSKNNKRKLFKIKNIKTQ